MIVEVVNIGLDLLARIHINYLPQYESRHSKQKDDNLIA